MKPLAAIAIATLLPGCVTVPIPPWGQQRGEMGDLKISVSVNYTPRNKTQTPATASQNYAWDQFFASKPKLLKDK
jgi:hypothetical protein